MGVTVLGVTPLSISGCPSRVVWSPVRCVRPIKWTFWRYQNVGLTCFWTSGNFNFKWPDCPFLGALGKLPFPLVTEHQRGLWIVKWVWILTGTTGDKVVGGGSDSGTGRVPEKYSSLLRVAQDRQICRFGWCNELGSSNRKTWEDTKIVFNLIFSFFLRLLK